MHRAPTHHSPTHTHTHTLSHTHTHTHTHILHPTPYTAYTAYTVLAQTTSDPSCQLRNWRLESSDDGDNWTILREHNDDSNIAADGEAGATASWPVDYSREEGYRYFRILQVGCWGGGWGEVGWGVYGCRRVESVERKRICRETWGEGLSYLGRITNVKRATHAHTQHTGADRGAGRGHTKTNRTHKIRLNIFLHCIREEHSACQLA